MIDFYNLEATIKLIVDVTPQRLGGILAQQQPGGTYCLVS